MAWDYEPTEFTLEWDDEGRAIRAFRPDFYLPAYNLYIEITTLNQRLVTKKNGKVRRLRELHPELEVKILYQRDYLNLLIKFGLEDAAALSEIEGSADTPPGPLSATAGRDGDP